MKTILVIEDEEDILDLLEYHLSKEGYDVISCIDTQNVKNILDEESISAVLMDRNLPGVEGSEYVLKLREQGYDFPLIFISAKNSSNDILDGFKSGADDYITKPFNIDELKARVKALIKRSSKEQDILKYRDITYNATNKTFYIEDKK